MTGSAGAIPGRAPVEDLVSRTVDGLAVSVLHQAADPVSSGAWRDPGRPVGLYQTIEHPDVAEAARQAAVDAGNGATGLNLALEGALSARGFGLPFDGLANVLEAVDPVATMLRIELPPGIGASRFERLIELLDARGHVGGSPSLHLASDPLGDAARTGCFQDGAPESTTLAWLTLPALRSLASPLLHADGRPHHDAGASEAQELAAVLSTAVFYLRALEGAGLPDPRLTFTLAADADHLLTVAKFRALRRLWARIEQACGLPSTPLHLRGETSWRMLARTDPWTNMMRATLGCAGAILGGADTVTVLPFTSANGLPDAFARRLARNTPLILIGEAGLAHVADPAAGSGTFEAWTEALCQAAWRTFQQLELEGGLAGSLRSGAWQARLEQTRRSRHAAIAAENAPLVGVTAYVARDARSPAVLLPARLVGDLRPPDGSSGDVASLRPFRDAAAFEAGSAAMSTETGQS